ncbi:MAG: glycosyltransferase, partial [Acidobacteria bacterium]
VLLDRMGALRAAYPLAQAAVLGGTFVPVGGHSPLEAAAAGCPLVSGPYVDKQADLVGPLERAGALVRTASPEEAAEALARWVLQPEAREAAGTAARVTLARHRGVAERIAPEVLACLG